MAAAISAFIERLPICWLKSLIVLVAKRLRRDGDGRHEAGGEKLQNAPHLLRFPKHRSSRETSGRASSFPNIGGGESSVAASDLFSIVPLLRAFLSFGSTGAFHEKTLAFLSLSALLVERNHDPSRQRFRPAAWALETPRLQAAPLNGGIQVRRPDRLKTARCNPTHFVQIRPAGAALVGKRHLGRRAAVFGLTAGDTTRRPIASSGRDRGRRRTQPRKRFPPALLHLPPGAVQPTGPADQLQCLRGDGVAE